MAETTSPTQIISLPQGGGALHGLGEKFAPDPHMGTGAFSVPIAVPAGRRGLEPKLDLVYSTGTGNGTFGLGWTLTVPGVARQTARGVPCYDDRRDTFILSGAEDLVPVDESDPTAAVFRPRTESTFLRIVRRCDPTVGYDYWILQSTDGLTSRYGSIRPLGGGAWRDSATIVDPDRPEHVFAWKLSETRDPFGNIIVYEYGTDEGSAGGHRWRQPVLRRIRYADYAMGGGPDRFVAEVAFDYEPRADAFSDYRAGFEVRTALRCRSITATTHAGQDHPVRRYELTYHADAYNGLSLLAQIDVVGFDEAGAEDRGSPPIEFGYTEFAPEGRSFKPVGGADPPAGLRRGGGLELVDVTGDGLPDVMQLGPAARFWRNLGGGVFDRPRPMRSTTGYGLTDPGVQLIDADGDGHADLLVTAAPVAGFFPLRFGGVWESFRPYRSAPTFDLADPEVRLVDMDGDGVTDALRAGTRWECWFQDTQTGWSGPHSPAGAASGPPPLRLSDPRVHLADMTGDGLSDMVLLHDRSIMYWPNLGHGRWGSQLSMVDGPRLPYGYDPKRVLIGDVDGDGCADLIYVGPGETTVWINRSGNAWSDPIAIKGTPLSGRDDDLRVVDLLGTGTAGVLFSAQPQLPGRPAMFFLDLSGGVKPGLLDRMTNNIGAVTLVEYAPSTRFALADATRASTRWRTALPIVVPVVAQVTIHDELSRGKHVTQYRYHHGYWDGLEREFRGFARVDQIDTETFEAYARPAATGPVAPVDRESFSAPVRVTTWYHPGPVGTEPVDGDAADWTELDLRDEYWADDRPLLRHAEGVTAFLSGMRARAGGGIRRARRDALRALRGSVLRTEMYALDGSPLQERPYTVTEYAHALREESASGEAGRPRVFFPYLRAQRTTQWERSDDPLTVFTFSGDHDGYGQPRWQSTVAIPRRAVKRQLVTAAVVGQFQPDTTVVLASHTRTEYAQPDAGAYIHDRMAQSHSYELTDPPQVAEARPGDLFAVLGDQAATAEAVQMVFEELDPSAVRLTGHRIHHYDGPAFVGLPTGRAGRYGAVTRTEMLVFTDRVLDDAYGAHRPTYLDGPEQPAVGAPARFGSALGYRRVMVGAQTARYYTDTAQLCHDFQASAVTPPLPERGLVVAVRDPLGHQTDITPDEYGLLPVSVRDPVGLVATAEYDYRFGQVRRMVDANGHATNYRYDPMGRLAASFRTGRDGDGGSESEPEVRYSHDLLAFRRDGQPISTHATRRVHYASSGLPGEVVAAREYTDGFGRSIQKRITADEMALGATGEDSGLLMPDAAGVPRTQPGKAAGPAVGARAADRVAVSGWRVYDNKGRLVHEYEPFFGTGWAYQPETEARRGNRTTTHYDPRGQVIRIVRADGTQIRTVFGAPDDVADPDHHKPSPWVVTAYDPNDLAPISTGHDGPLTSAAPPAHHFTPTTTIRDALGRTVCQLVRAGPNPAADWHAQRTAYDVRGNPLWTVDALGRVALRHQYDLADRPLRVTSIDAGDRWSVVDAAGNAVYQADVGGHAIARTYDRANREVDVLARDRPDQPLTVRERRRYGDGGDPAQSAIDRAVARTANLLGRLSELYDGAGLITFDRYDFVGHPTHQSRQVISDAAIAAADASGGWTADWAAEGAANDLDPVGYETITAYDALERVIDIRTDAADHQSCIVPRYGRSGALAGVDVDGTPYLNLVVRDASGRRLLAAFGNGLMTRYGYDPYTRRPVRSRTERCTAAGDTWTGTGPPLLDLTYTYDLVGNITETEERTRGCGLAGPANDPDRLNRTFGYDPLYRLISATGRACSNIALPRPFEDLARCGADVPYVPGSPTPNQVNAPNLTVSYTETYRYDPVGNLLELGHTAGGATWYRRFGMAGLAPQQWQAATTNHATSVVAGKQTRQLRYDTVGNLIGENADREYVWDHAGRLIGFQKRAGAQPSISARYLYGADGARVKKWVRRGNSPSHDESTVYINRNMEHHRWKKCGGGDHVLLHVLDGPSRVATIRSGPPHPDDTGPAVRYQHDDQIGSTTLVVDATGAWMNREEYFPFGETSFGGFARKRYRFMGRERDEETGNCHHGARYYAPALCRWMSPDPAGPVDGPNLYAFVAGNPVRLADPTGTSGLELVTAAETTELVAQQAVVTTTVTTQAATSAGVDTIITLEQIAAQEAAGAQVIIGGPATTATPILAPVAVGAAGALLFLGIMGFAYVCASHSGDHVKAKMERLAAQLEQAREEREKRYAPPPPHQGPKIAPPANPFAGVVGDPPTQPEPLLAPGAEPRRHVEFPPVTIEGEMQLSKLDMETIGELQKVGSTQSYQYVIEIQLDETIHKPGQTVDPVGRFRKYYKEYGDSLVKMVVYAPTATPNARAGETERIGALGARAANIRKNTLSEIRGGAGYQGVIEIPKVGVVGVIRNRFWDQCDF